MYDFFSRSFLRGSPLPFPTLQSLSLSSTFSIYFFPLPLVKELVYKEKFVARHSIASFLKTTLRIFFKSTLMIRISKGYQLFYINLSNYIFLVKVCKEFIVQRY